MQLESANTEVQIAWNICSQVKKAVKIMNRKGIGGL